MLFKLEELANLRHLAPSSAKQMRLERSAPILYSLTRTCAVRGIPPQLYLTDVLTMLADGWPLERIDELTPAHWAKTHADELEDLEP